MGILLWFGVLAWAQSPSEPVEPPLPPPPRPPSEEAREKEKAEEEETPAEELFPGACSDVDSQLGEVEDCVRAAARCEACLKINAFDGLNLDCDQLDDFDPLNGSCTDGGNG